jgi:hypothetical protein
MDECQGLLWLTKRDFFRLFWMSWKIAFISENMLLVFINIGLSPFNLELIL